MNPAFALAEVLWILSGRNDARFLNFFNSGLPEFAGGGDTYPGAYGHRLRAKFRTDQLTRAIGTLRRNPESRQVVLQIWDVHTDLPRRDGSARSDDVPCNIVSLLKVRRGKLELTQIVRSNDVFRGVPYNFVQFTTLQEVLSGWLELDLGGYAQLSDSLHVYERDLASLRSAPPQRLLPRNPDSLAHPRTVTERAVRVLTELFDDLIAGRLEPGAVLHRIDRTKMPIGFRNIGLMLCAEAARRRNAEPVARDAMADCTNPVYSMLWSRWTHRILRGRSHGRSPSSPRRIAGGSVPA